MNYVERVPDGSRCDLGYSRLALMAVCAIFVTAAIDRQLAAQARAPQADCVHCIDDVTAGAAGRWQGSLVTNAGAVG